MLMIPYENCIGRESSSKKRIMPEIARFYEIVIKLFFGDYTQEILN